MSRNLRSGELREDILDDLRRHDSLLELLDTSDVGTEAHPVDTVENPKRQIYSQQTVQDTDFPVSIGIGLLRTGGETTQSTTSGDFIVQATVTARLGWRQAIDQDPDRPLSESVMDEILSAVGERANIAFGIPYLQAGGLVGGSETLPDPDDGGQWHLPARWEVTRSVVGNDGPRTSD